MSKTLLVFLLFLTGAVVGGLWWFAGGAEDGAPLVTYSCLGVAFIIAVGSRVFNGAWFTDSSGGR